MSAKRAVLGLDLSLTAPAAVTLYRGWEPGDGMWSGRRLRSKCWAKEIVEHQKWHAEAYGAESWPFEHLDWIARAIARFADQTGATDAFVEEYAFNARGTDMGRLRELGGVVKVQLYKYGLLPISVPAASARKTLLGRVPTKKTSGVDVKDYVNEKLARMGAKFATMDEGDAFVVANHGRALLGLSCVGVSE